MASTPRSSSRSSDLIVYDENFRLLRTAGGSPSVLSDMSISQSIVENHAPPPRGWIANREEFRIFNQDPIPQIGTRASLFELAPKHKIQLVGSRREIVLFCYCAENDCKMMSYHLTMQHFIVLILCCRLMRVMKHYQLSVSSKSQLTLHSSSADFTVYFVVLHWRE